MTNILIEGLPLDEFLAIKNELKLSQEESTKLKKSLDKVLKIADERTHYEMFSEELRDIRGVVRELEGIKK